MSIIHSISIHSRNAQAGINKVIARRWKGKGPLCVIRMRMLNTIVFSFPCVCTCVWYGVGGFVCVNVCACNINKSCTTSWQWRHFMQFCALSSIEGK